MQLLQIFQISTVKWDYENFQMQENVSIGLFFYLNRALYQ